MWLLLSEYKGYAEQIQRPFFKLSLVLSFVLTDSSTSLHDRAKLELDSATIFSSDCSCLKVLYEIFKLKAGTVEQTCKAVSTLDACKCLWKVYIFAASVAQLKLSL